MRLSVHPGTWVRIPPSPLETLVNQGFFLFVEKKRHPEKGDKIKNYGPAMLVMDASERNQAISRELLTNGIKPLFLYKSPMLKDFFVNTSIYDEAYDCYLCLENWILYRTVNGDGYKEYQSRGEVCANCQDSINVRKVKNM